MFTTRKDEGLPRIHCDRLQFMVCMSFELAVMSLQSRGHCDASTSLPEGGHSHWKVVRGCAALKIPLFQAIF